MSYSQTSAGVGAPLEQIVEINALLAQEPCMSHNTLMQHGGGTE